jgi:hypothetical protein
MGRRAGERESRVAARAERGLILSLITFVMPKFRYYTSITVGRSVVLIA